MLWGFVIKCYCLRFLPGSTLTCDKFLGSVTWLSTLKKLAWFVVLLSFLKFQKFLMQEVVLK